MRCEPGRLAARIRPDFGLAVAISGTARAGKLMGDNTIEVSNSREGVVIGKSTYTLSSDGKILTVTTMLQKGGEPSVGVYEKQ
jgi:hypothetical protein